ncbi:cupin domain-containing protein [Halosimplex litoreum]|uniref:Cupin domain-containing protein n=1 Tax=Halosimplex litoreum TaxID=1198301 RepID=A0A7T3FXN9_9EURY|nr:cupin domain-containing protein [Halosimplex litoreum]QPV62467.1 cupin domain-containing protein [Halosimplex litoreum]
MSSPTAGKTVLFTERPDDPGRDPLRFEMWLDADGSHGPMRHVHPEQEEFFTVVGGRLGVSHEGVPAEYGPGERVEIAAGDEHRFWNAGSTELHLRGGVDPGLRTEAFMRITYGLARDGEPVTPSGMPPNLVQVAVLLAAAVGRLLGYENEYPEHRP